MNCYSILAFSVKKGEIWRWDCVKVLKKIILDIKIKNKNRGWLFDMNSNMIENFLCKICMQRLVSILIDFDR